MTTENVFKDMKDCVSSALVDTTRTAGQISNEDLTFHRSSTPSIIPLLEQQNTRLLQLAQRLTRSATFETEVSAPPFPDLDSLEDNWQGIVDVFDSLLEKADACLDEYTGTIKRLSPSQEDKVQKAVPSAGKQRPSQAYRTQNIAKPQLLFNKVPTNDESEPFKPLLQSKPHAITPLDASLASVLSADGSTQYALHSCVPLIKAAQPSQTHVDNPCRHMHPYETEIKQSQYPAATYVRSDPIPYLPYATTNATFVETPEAVVSMLQELQLAKEIAVDLEHHDEHSYVGLVSLMQISTRDKDWIVDTLKPWREELQILNEVFANPNILKIFHGAFMDMIWLQRDLGLYVVGLFDTFHASRSLGYPKNSLAYLLKRFADFDAAKQYQMADWRIRPLPEEMFNYARSDTHFLLYIYDNLRNELIEKSDRSPSEGNLIDVVMKDSKEESLQRYERPIYDFQHGLGAMGWYNMLCRTPALFSREQFAVFRAVHEWRNKVARQEDESLHQIMPKHVLYSIAREMPSDMPSLLGCSHPVSNIFQRRKQDLLSVIKTAKMAGFTGPEMKDLMQIVYPVHIDHVNSSGARQAVAESGTAIEHQMPKATSQSNVLARANISSFWGTTIRSQADTPRLHLHDGNPRLALPLPHLTAEIFENYKARATAALEVRPTSPSLRVENDHTKNRKSKDDEIFVVKQAGGSRKRKAADEYNAPEFFPSSTDIKVAAGASKEVEEVDKPPAASHSNQHIELDRQLQRTAEEKHQKRLEKKRLKKEMLLLHAEGVASTQDPGEAFDYVNAPSLLHASRENGDSTGGGVNPYSKSRDAPKGMRKTTREVSGKSLTFKG